MKRSILMLLVMSAALIFFGCEKMDPLSESGNDLDTASLKAAKVKIPFTGICAPTDTPPEPPSVPVVKILPNGKTKITDESAWWYDDASTPLLTGYTKWMINRIIDTDGVQKIWGKTIIDLDDDLGEWVLSWHGFLYPTLDEEGLPIGMNGYCGGVAVGKEGAVKGMTAKMLYTLDYIASDPTTLFYATEGVINPHGK